MINHDLKTGKMKYIYAAGFRQVQINEKINTVFGTLDLLTAKKTVN